MKVASARPSDSPPVVSLLGGATHLHPDLARRVVGDELLAHHKLPFGATEVR